MKAKTTDRMFIAAMTLAVAGALTGCNREQPAATTDTAPMATDTTDAMTPAPMPEPAMPAATGGHSKMAMMDKNSDGMVSMEEHNMGASSMFTSTDADSNGMVSMTEMEAGMRAMGDDMPAASMIKMMDKNGDGMVSSDEHVAGASAMFKKMDADGNSSMTAAEMQAGHDMMMKDGM